MCINDPDDKTYEYYNADTKKIDTIKFLNYIKWYKENKAVWNLADYGNAEFKLQYFHENNMRLFIKIRQDNSINKPNLMLILERINKTYTKNGDRINESTDWIHYFYQSANKWKGSQDL